MSARLERVEVERPADEPLVAVERVEPLDQPGRLGVGERPPVDGRSRRWRRAAPRSTGRMSGARRGAGRRLDLEPVVDPRVVARGDDDAGRRAALDDLVRAHLGRHGVDREGDRDVVGEEDLGGGQGEVLRREPAVVGDDDALGLLAALDDVARRRRRRSAGRCRT